MRRALGLGVVVAVLAGCASSKKPEPADEKGPLRLESTRPEPGPCPTATGASDARWCGDPRHDKARVRFERGDFRAAVSLGTRALEELHASRQRVAREDRVPLGGPAFLLERAEEVRILTLRGLARSAVGEHDRALDDFTLALELDPEFTDALLGRGTERLATGDAGGAIADLSAALRFAPDSAVGFANRANAHALSGDFQRAFVDYAAAIELAPRRVANFRNRARVRLATGDQEGAIEDMKRAVELDPGDDATRASLKRLRRTS